MDFMVFLRFCWISLDFTGFPWAVELFRCARNVLRLQIAFHRRASRNATHSGTKNSARVSVSDAAATLGESLMQRHKRIHEKPWKSQKKTRIFHENQGFALIFFRVRCPPFTSIPSVSVPKSVSICVESLWIAFFIPEIDFQISKIFDFRSQKILYRKFSDYHWFWSFVITCSKRSTCRKEEPRHLKKNFLRKIFFAKISKKLHSCAKSPTDSKNSARGVQTRALTISGILSRISRISSPDDNFPQDHFLLLRDLL